MSLKSFFQKLKGSSKNAKERLGENMPRKDLKAREKVTKSGGVDKVIRESREDLPRDISAI